MESNHERFIKRIKRKGKKSQTLAKAREYRKEKAISFNG